MWKRGMIKLVQRIEEAQQVNITGVYVTKAAMSRGVTLTSPCIHNPLFSWSFPINRKKKNNIEKDLNAEAGMKTGGKAKKQMYTEAVQ